MKLQGNELTLHRHRKILLDELSKILWFIMECVKDIDQKVSEAA